MPLKQAPTFKVTADKMMEIPQPAIKGLNLNNLEYELDVNQSPKMLNMMYKNGVFCKRYGQVVDSTYDDDINALTYFNDKLIVHSGTNIYIDDELVADGIADQKGMFVEFKQSLYYFCDEIYEYKLDSDVWLWETIQPYIPTVVINRKPDASDGDTSEAYNMIGTGFINKFHGDASSTTYQLTDTNLDHGAKDVPIVEIDNVKWTYDSTLATTHSFKVDYSTGVITLSEAAGVGTNNVVITAYKGDSEWQDYHDQIVNSKYYACFGGNNNSRLFVAGGGKSFYYYSDVYDATYFPYTNYARLGNSVEDITGFGQQYGNLLIFKPSEIYSLTYYVATSDTTTSESQEGIGMFSSTIVNNQIGCDCPYSIQLVNNYLTWLNSKYGVCTLVSSSIVDERNVRVISENINHTNNLGVEGILDMVYEPSLVKSCEYEQKYFISFPNGKCFIWDYEISPFSVTSSKVTNPATLAWYLFDNIYVNDFLRIGGTMYFSSTRNSYTNKLCKLTDVKNDFGTAINAYYQTPLNQFNAVEYLKTVKNLYVQCRGDIASTINMKCITEDDPNGESVEPINIYSNIFDNFAWETFGWEVLNFVNTFRRKISIKKFQVLSILFYNNELNCDMSISHLAMQYQIIKYIK